MMSFATSFILFACCYLILGFFIAMKSVDMLFDSKLILEFKITSTHLLLGTILISVLYPILFLWIVCEIPFDRRLAKYRQQHKSEILTKGLFNKLSEPKDDSKA